MKKTLFLIVALSLALAVPTLAADTVKIGLTAPITGSWAAEGQDMKQICELLADQVNSGWRTAGQKHRGRGG